MDLWVAQGPLLVGGWSPFCILPPQGESSARVGHGALSLFPLVFPLFFPSCFSRSDYHPNLLPLRGLLLLWLWMAQCFREGSGVWASVLMHLRFSLFWFSWSSSLKHFFSFSSISPYFMTCHAGDVAPFNPHYHPKGKKNLFFVVIYCVSSWRYHWFTFYSVL